MENLSKPGEFLKNKSTNKNNTKSSITFRDESHQEILFNRER
jgi:hypothetical protein